MQPFYSMNPKITSTADGSYTLRLEEMDETYHSTNGALTEARHVFVQNGFNSWDKKDLRILEVGFGTGLNAMVTLDAFLKQSVVERVHYTTLEKYPVAHEICSQIAHGNLFEPKLTSEYKAMCAAEWEQDVEVLPNFLLHKKHFDLIEQNLDGEYDLVYFDAFAPSKQADMWSLDILRKSTNVMAVNSIFVTYCAKGEVRRNLQSLGLEMHRVPGPPGKREMLVGKK